QARNFRKRWNQSRKAFTAKAAIINGTARPAEYAASRSIPRPRLSEAAASAEIPPRIGPMQGVHRAPKPPEAGSPPRREGHPHENRSEIAQRFVLQVKPALLLQEGEAEHAEADQAEDDDQDAPDPLHPNLGER